MVAGSEHGRRQGAEAGVPALSVVYALDELEDGGAGLPSGGSGASADALELQVDADVLGDGVILAGDRPAEALGDAGVP